MEKKNIADASFCDTGYSYTLSLIAGKYKPIILYCLMEYEPVRFNQMQRYLGHVADKTLSQNLKELEADGLIHRREYPQIPPKVEYSLSEKGKSLIPILGEMCDWGEAHRELWRYEGYSKVSGVSSRSCV
jgi:DNA-binding HxlR family transcriptional regulator